MGIKVRSFSSYFVEWTLDWGFKNECCYCFIINTDNKTKICFSFFNFQIHEKSLRLLDSQIKRCWKSLLFLFFCQSTVMNIYEQRLSPYFSTLRNKNVPELNQYSSFLFVWFFFKTETMLKSLGKNVTWI